MIGLVGEWFARRVFKRNRSIPVDLFAVVEVGGRQYEVVGISLDGLRASLSLEAK